MPAVLGSTASSISFDEITSMSMSPASGTMLAVPSAATLHALEAVSSAMPTPSNDTTATCASAIALPLANVIILALNLMALCTLLALGLFELRRRHKRIQLDATDAYSTNDSEHHYKSRPSDTFPLSPFSENRQLALKIDSPCYTPRTTTPIGSPTSDVFRCLPSPLGLSSPLREVDSVERTSFLPELKPPRRIPSISSMRSTVVRQFDHKPSMASFKLSAQ